MSVLVKGMEKPEHCGYCRFRYDGICHALQKTQYRMDECPLVGIDAVSVVSCKDCKNWDTDWQTIEGCHYCSMVDFQTEGEWFCADGERREE